jgi:hypothetical protein
MLDLTIHQGLEMQSGSLPRRVFAHRTSSPRDESCSGWFLPAHDPTPVKMPSERLIRAVLANFTSWLDSLEEIAQHAHPENKMRALHLKRNMLQCQLSLIRLSGGSEEEIQAAQAKAKQGAAWPGDGDKDDG